MKDNIFNDTLNYDLSKEEIDKLTYESRIGNETLDAIYGTYLQQRRLRGQ